MRKDALMYIYQRGFQVERDNAHSQKQYWSSQIKKTHNYIKFNKFSTGSFKNIKEL